MGYSVVKVARS